MVLLNIPTSKMCGSDEQRARADEWVEHHVPKLDLRLVGHDDGQLRVHARVADELPLLQRVHLDKVALPVCYLWGMVVRVS